MSKPALIPELYIRDFEQSLSFYVSKLGFQVLYSRDEEKFAMLEREGAQIMMEQIGIGRNWITAGLSPPFGRGINFQIEVSDIISLHNNIQSQKLSFFLDIEEKWYRVDQGHVGNKQFIIQDPDGYLLRFFQDLGEKT